SHGRFEHAESPFLVGEEDCHESCSAADPEQDSKQSVMHAEEPAGEEGNAGASDDVVDEGNHARGGGEKCDVRPKLKRGDRTPMFGPEVIGSLRVQRSVIASDPSDAREVVHVFTAYVNETNDGEHSEKE